MVLKNLCCGKSHDNGEESLRQVVPVHLLPESVKRSSHRHPHYGYKGNKVCTTKYNLITFLPRNLFEQFHRVANIIFLLIGLLNFLPSVNALIPEIALLPLLFVLFVTAVKDAYEDYRRFRSDKEINNLTCRKYSRTERRYVKTHWSQLHVGDFVHLSCNEAIPADLILIRSSDKDGICRIDTSNLDGENNLKQRIVVKGVPQGDEFHPTLFTHNIECDQPNMKIYDFNGSMVDVMQQRTPINTDNFLLRGCIIRNTAYVEGIIVYAGHETKAMLNNRGPRYKQSKIEHQINRDILFCMAIMLFMCFLSALGNGLWLQSVDNPEGVIYLQFAQDNLYDAPYAAFLSFWTFIIVYQAFIPLALYVTIELVKLGQVFFIQQDIHMYHSAFDRRIQCRALNITEELGQIEHVFSDKTGTLTENQMLFKRCTIGGLDYAYPPREVIDDNISVFGSDSLAGGSLHDLSLSGSSPSSPPTTPQVIPTTPKLGKFLPDPTLHQAVSMMSLHSISAVNDAIPEEMGRIQEFFLIMAICNTVVVTAQPHQDNMDDTGVVREIETKPPPKLYNRFKQKILRKQGAAAKVKSPTSKSPRHSLGSNGFLANASTENLTYVSEADSDSISTMLMSENPDGCYYEAESPDELALTQAACLYGCKLLNRTVDHATVWLPAESEEVKVDVLHILPFDSQRKRMSVIVRVNNNNLVLYCKGADSNIFSNLKPFTTDDDDADKIVYNQTQRYITEYARQGLRTLCMAKKTLDEDTYTEWLKDHRLAEDAVTERGSLLYESACRMETDLTLLGATGIEDRLQDGVAETIDSLRMAGIKVWVLTGDKQETAMNIAYSCNLLSFDQEIIALNARNQDMTTDLIREHLSNVNSSHNTDHCNDVKEKALVIDGVTLAYALNPEVADDFVKLTSHCSSVLCCRTTPSQKAAVVTLVKEKQKKLTLAIGDGANDVSMIQTGDVGVGISGQEGMQAVMASDFALPRFRFLKRLLLVHGHWCYDRLARMICLMYYKNAAFVNLLMWFQIFNGFSGVAQVDDINLLIFSVVYTSIPPIVMGVLDQNMPDSTLMAFPHLYDRCQSSKSYRWYDLFLSLGDALWQSAAQFFIPYFALLGSNVGVYEMGFLMNTACVVCFFCHYAIESFHWHVIHIIGVLVSLLLFVATNYVCSILSTSYPPLSTVYGVFVNTTSMVEFWLLLPIVIVVALLPRFVMRSLQGSLWPHRCLRVRQYHKQIEKLNAQKLKNSENNGHLANGNGIIRNHEEDRLNTNGRVPNGGLTSNGQVTNSQSVELQAPAVSFENGTTTIYDDDVVISNTRF